MQTPKQRFWGGLFLTLVSVLGLFFTINITRRDMERGYFVSKSGEHITKDSPSFGQMMTLRHVVEGMCVITGVLGVVQAARATT